MKSWGKNVKQGLYRSSLDATVYSIDNVLKYEKESIQIAEPIYTIFKRSNPSVFDKFDLEKLFAAFDDLIGRGAKQFKFVDRTFNLKVKYNNKV